MTWGPDVETNLAISSANHLKVRFIQQSPFEILNILTSMMLNSRLLPIVYRLKHHLINFL
ncbi:hypothetical protein E3U36_06320 [Arsenophonus endosymbiont of Aphis craccivora]|uniref:hypothetical protein n=1 Tax=Arsenophonus endosymbiont of Aphis craccivora TaxID=1231049 RepID=UPI0015DC5604|nr:hypothetical protein [Arsenophonus endosymbiont of Aphis craccivora]QLK87825.1 hypothetical protein E3U36_06320 [Arsenophonus endosymbiont of Aphis craccivora]